MLSQTRIQINRSLNRITFQIVRELSLCMDFISKSINSYKSVAVGGTSSLSLVAFPAFNKSIAIENEKLFAVLFETKEEDAWDR